MRNMATLTVEFQSKGYAKVYGEMKNVRKEAGGVVKAHGNLHKAQQRTHDSASKINKTFTISSGRLKVIGRDINRYVTLPFTVAVAATTKFANDLNRGLANVQTLIPNTGDRIYELRDGVTALSQATGRSFDDINKGLYRTISVFQDNAETMDRLTSATEAAIAGMSSIEDAVQLASSVTRAYGDTTAAAVEKVYDLAFVAVQMGDTTFPQLASAMQIATDRAVRLNISQQELFTTFATLTGITGDASMVATQFRSAMDSLLNPTDELASLLERYGFASAKAAVESRGMVDVLGMIADEAERTGNPIQKYITRKEGITLATRLAGEQLGDFQKKLVDVTNSVGAKKEAFRTATEEINKYGIAMDMAKESMRTAAAEIGQNLLPIVNALFQTMAAFTRGLADTPKAVQLTVTSITALIAALGGLAMAAGVIRSMNMAGTFIYIEKAAGVLATKLTVLTGATVTLKAVMFGVVGVVAALVAGIAAYGLTAGREERKIEEATEATNLALKERLRLIEEGVRLYDDLRIAAQGLTPSRRREFREAGAIPQIGDTAGIDLSEIQNDPEALRTAIAEYEKNISMIEESFDIGTYELGQYNEKIKELSEGYKELDQIQVKLADAEFFGKTNVDQLRFLDQEIGNITPQLEEVRQALKAGYLQGSAVPFAREQALAWGEQLEQLKLARDLTQQIGEYEAKISLAEMDPGSGVSAEQLADYRAAVDLLRGIQAQVAGSSAATESSLKTWQEWANEILDINVDTAKTAGSTFAKAYREKFDTEMSNYNELANLMGFTPDNVGRLEDRLDDIKNRAIKLLDLDDEDVQGKEGFNLTDYIMSGEDESILNDYIDTLRATANAMYDSNVNSWKTASAEVDRYNEALQDSSKSMESIFDDADFWDKQVQDINDQMQKLVEHGIDPSAEAFKQLADQMRFAGNMAEVAAAKSLSYQDIMSNMSKPDMENVLGGMLFNEMSNTGLESIERKTSEIQRELAFAEEHGITSGAHIRNLENDLENFTEQIKTMKDGFALLSTAVAGFLVQAMDPLSSYLNEVAYAMGQGQWAAEDYTDSLKNLGFELLRLIPKLAMSAGLQLIGDGQYAAGFSLLAIGGALDLGLGMVESYAQGRSDADGDRMASGGIINTPTAVVGEAGPEAVLPLARNQKGDLGVAGVGGGVTNVSITVINETGVPVETEEKNDGNGNIQLIMKRAVKNVLASGSADKELSSRYGIRPNAM